MKQRQAPNLAALAMRLDCDGPRLSPMERQIALAVHRCMAYDSTPPADARIAEVAGASPDYVAASLAGWPGVHRDELGGIVGFWGLALDSVTPHRLRVRGRVLHTWCAWDALFLPELLGADRADVASVCPVTGRKVRVMVTPRGIEGLQPTTARLTMVDSTCCDAQPEDEGVIPTFCRNVHLVASVEDGACWMQEAGSRASLLTIEEGWRLGRLTNRLRYGAALEKESTCS